MGTEDNSFLFTDFFDQFADLDDLVRIKPCCRLIEYQHFRIMYQRLGKAYTLLISFR